MGPETIGAVAGKEITETLSRVLDSPAQEIGNYIADKIRYLRYKSLLRIVEKANASAKAKNLNLKMPPLKFFVPFCEGASLEDESSADTNLEELWANLLVQAATDFDPRHMVFLRLLKEITSSEAWFSDLLINHSRARTFASPLSWSHYEEAPFLGLIYMLDPTSGSCHKEA